MTVGDILDHAIRLYRQNFVGMVTIVAIANVPLMLIQLVTVWSNFFYDIFSLTVLVGGILGIFQNAALIYYVSKRFNGQAVTIRQAYARVYSRARTLVLAMVWIVLGNSISLLIAIGFLITFLLAMQAAFVHGPSPLETLAGQILSATWWLIIPAFLFFVYLMVHWLFVPQAIIIEDYKARGALGRSWRLVHGPMDRVLGVGFILLVMVSLIAPIASYLASFLSEFLPNALAIPFIFFVGGLLTILISPLQPTGLTLLYYDLRMRQEGIDLEMRLQQLDLESPVSSL